MKEKAEALFIGVFTTLFSWIGYLLIPTLALAIFNIMDYITRFIAAKANGEVIQSKKSIKGIYKKAGMWCLIASCAVVDLVLVNSVDIVGVRMPFRFVFSTIVAMWLVFNEFISILENISYGGTKFPSWIVEFANRVLGKIDGKGNDLVNQIGKDE